MPKRLKFVVETLNSECFLWYDGKRGRRGDSKFSNRPVTFESNRIGTSDSNSNRILKLHRSLVKRVLFLRTGTNRPNSRSMTRSGTQILWT